VDGDATPASCNYDRIADRYEELRGGAARADAIAEVLAPLIGHRRALDIGVGTGIIAAALEERGCSVWGVDIAASMLAHARHRLRGRVVCASGERIPARDASFEVALFNWSLHLIGDQIAALREAARVAGGRCIIVVSARTGPQTDEIGALFTRLFVLRPREDDPLPPLFAAASLQIIDEGTIALAFAQSPNEQAQIIEDRGYSPLWDLDDDRWRAIVQPVIDELRALPDPDRPRDRVLRQPYHVLMSP
jgi:SAM-dependent methyltransferase